MPDKRQVIAVAKCGAQKLLLAAQNSIVGHELFNLALEGTSILLFLGLNIVYHYPPHSKKYLVYWPLACMYVARLALVTYCANVPLRASFITLGPL